MPVFSAYSAYYDAIYRHKSYREEAAFVLDALGYNGCSSASILDLGCGTGRHAVELTRMGLRVTGVDLSAAMIAAGQKWDESESEKIGYPPTLLQGDIRSLSLGSTFSYVCSLFHVMSYQTSESELLASFKTAHAHLEPGGLFLFDFWYGPAVLAIKPEKRELSVKTDVAVIRRTASPLLHLNKNIVDVAYEISVHTADGEHLGDISEVHSMRYWFAPELRFLAEEAGFSVMTLGAWMQNREPDERDWAAWMLLKKSGR